MHLRNNLVLKYLDGIYEIVSTSIGISLMAVFGILSLLPIELMILGMDNDTLWIYSALILGVCIAWFILRLFGDRIRIIMRIIDVILAVLSTIVLTEFISHNGTLMEPWITQGAWFLHEQGISVAFFMGFNIIKTAAGLFIAMSKPYEKKTVDRTDNLERYEAKREELENPEKTPTPGEKSLSLRTNGNAFALVFLSMLFVIGLFAVYCFTYPYYFYLILMISETFFACIAMLPFVISSDKEDKSRAFELYFDHPVYDKQQILENREEDPCREPDGRLKKWFLQIYNQNNVYMTDRDWELIKWLLFIAGLTIIGMVSHGLGLYFKAFIQMEYAQVFIVVALVNLLIHLSISGFLDKNQPPYGKFFKGGEVPHFFAKMERFQYFGIVIFLSFVLYYYQHSQFVLEIIIQHLIWGLIGITGYFLLTYIVEKIISMKAAQLTRIILYAVAIALAITDIWLIRQDGLLNGYEYEGPSITTVFVFDFLFSLDDSIYTGIAFGIIVAEFIYKMSFNDRSGLKAESRALTVIITPFILGLCLLIFNLMLSMNPGTEYVMETEGMFEIITQALMVIGVIIFALYLILELLLPFIAWIKKRKLDPDTKNQNQKKFAWKYTSESEENRDKHIKPARKLSSQHRNQIKAGALICIIGVTLFASIAVPVSFRKEYAKTIIASNPDNYFVWVAGSSERVDPHVPVSVAGSERTAYAELELAKNEYGAIQFVWNTYDHSITNLNYTIDDFQHISIPSENIPAKNSSLRKVVRVNNDTFPDVLEEFQSTNFTRNLHNTLWFSVRTPYDAEAGVYTNNITFNFLLDGEPSVQKLRVKLKLWNFTIPNTRHMRTRYGRAEWTMRDQKTWISHRVSSDGCPITQASSLSQLHSNPEMTCYLDTSTNEWTFNWTWWDNQTKWLLDNNANLFTLRTGVSLDRIPQYTDPNLEPRIRDYFEKVNAHFVSKGWAEYAYIYFIDEFEMFVPDIFTREGYFTYCAVVMSWMKQSAPDIKLMVTGPTEEDFVSILDPYIDIYCPTTYDRDKPTWDERLAAGKEMWMYACVGPISPYPNNHYYDRLFETRILNWQVWNYKGHGYMGWSAKNHRHGAWGIGHNGWGDGIFLYEDAEGNQYESIRWENVLEAHEDYEYCWILNATLNNLEENSILTGADISAYRSEFYTWTHAIAGERWIYTDNVNDIYEARTWIGETLDELSQYTNLTSIAEQVIDWTDFSIKA